MHVGKNLLLYGAVIIYEDFLGDHMVSGGNQGEGGGGAGFSTSRGNSEKIDCQSYGIIRTLQSLMGGGGAEESLIVTHPHDK